jgi:hypothetical protein
MNFGLPELLVIFAVMLAFVLPIWGVIDAAIRPDRAWKAAGQSQVVWVIVMLLLPLIGAIVYFAVIRPKVREAAL